MRKFFDAVLCLMVCLVTLLSPSALAAEGALRGLWVATVLNLDYPSAPTTDPEVLKAEATTILDDALDMGMNAVFLQVRPCSDALYPSAIFPWSRYLTGAQGVEPEDGFDPLDFWVTESHARGIELHAWINPYRITREKDHADLTPSHPAVLHPEYVVQHSDGNWYFDPGVPEVRELVIQGVLEIARNYPVDGIHLDDYFYPGASFQDQQSFLRHNPEGVEDKESWRRENVNVLIRDMGLRLHALRPGLSFGISPFGIWANRSTFPEGSDTAGNQSYFLHSADTRRWVLEGWIDYIAPQLYWEVGHKKADYAVLLSWWAGVVRGTGVDLYIGMGDYRMVGAKAGSPWYGLEEIRRQMVLNRRTPEVAGEIHFRYGSIGAVPGLHDFLKEAHAGQ